MRIEKKVTVDAPRRLVWDYVTEPANYCVFIEGLTRWDVAGDKDKGLGARYRMLIRVGAADVRIRPAASRAAVRKPRHCAT